MKKIISILILCFPTFLLACSIYETTSFNLHKYDKAVNIIEVQVTKKIKSNYETLKAQYQKDTINWNEPKRPKPFPSPPKYNDFEIEIIQMYKGNANTKITKLRASGLNTSCYWEPKIGEKYIFYLNDVEIENGVEHLEIYSSLRQLNVEASYYQSKKSILEFLQKK